MAHYSREQSRRWQKDMDNTAIEVAKPLQDEEIEGVAQVVKPVECDFCECQHAEINHLLEKNRALKHDLRRRTMDEASLKEV